MPNPGSSGGVLDGAPRGLMSLRSENRRMVMHELQRRREVSRADLARATRLSTTTVSSLVAELVERGLVTESGRDDRGSGRTGRPGRLVRLVSSRELVAAVDMAHDSIRVAVLDLAGSVLAESAERRDVDGAAESTLRRANEMLQDVIASAGAGTTVRQVVLGIPGVLDPVSGTIKSDRMAPWTGSSPARLFATASGLATIAENDSNLAALGEWAFGAGQGLEDLLFIRFSAGIGAGLIIGGRLYRSAHGAAGELGHVQVREDGALCSCGNRGCLETLATVPHAVALLSPAHPSVTGPEDVTALIAAGDRAAIRVVTDMGLAVGRVVANLCNVLAPQAVVVGGDLPGPPQPLLDALAGQVSRYTHPRIASTIEVRPAKLGARAGIMGAAAVAMDTHPLLEAAR